jgi:hypothetical protein
MIYNVAMFNIYYITLCNYMIVTVTFMESTDNNLIVTNVNNNIIIHNNNLHHSTHNINYQ